MRLPDFLVAGAMKCGTTSLLHNLRQHPCIGCPSWELRFFDNNWDKGWEWYGKHFSPFNTRLVGEKSPFYVADETCHHRIRSGLPDVKWILLYRNPIDRWISHWRMLLSLEIGRGHESKISELKDAAILLNHQLQIEKETGKAPPMLSYGNYATQLRALFNIFSCKQVHIGIAERISANYFDYYQSVCDFLGIENIEGMGTIRSNVYDHVNQPLPVPLSIRKVLLSYYQGQILEMKELLSDNLHEWSDPAPFL